MDRYVVLIKNQADSKTAEALKDKVRPMQSNPFLHFSSFRNDRLTILRRRSSADDSILDDRVQIFGKIFRKHAGSDGPISSGIEPSDLKNIPSTSGRSLLANFWGNYVAVVLDDRGNYHIIRDPTGAIPCYWVANNGIIIVFSHLEDYLKFSTEKRPINWNHIGAYLIYDRLVSRETGYSEISQLLPGECLTISPENNVQTSTYWHPARLCRDAVISEIPYASHLLRKEVLTCVQQWGSCYENILHDLSGGLDSSLVLMCLASSRVRPNVLCWNLYTEQSEGDERHFARIVATRAQYPLLESLVSSPDTPLELKVNVAGIASPVLSTFEPITEALRTKICQENSIGAMFSGQGGDHLFQQHVSELLAAEYIRRSGLRTPLVQLLLGIAQSTRKPVWRTVSATLLSYSRNASYNPYEAFRPPEFLSGDLYQERSAIQHPWLAECGDLPLAKVQQIFFLGDCQILNCLQSSYAHIVNPLISQPIIEACLRIPSFVLATGGRDRQLARVAFSDLLPREITDRTTKGGSTGYMHRLLIDNADYIRDVLTSGFLVRKHLIDRQRLEKALRPESLIKGTDAIPVFTALQAELWVSDAIGNLHQAAA